MSGAPDGYLSGQQEIDEVGAMDQEGDLESAVLIELSVSCTTFLRAFWI
jgi:hypothetical protein